MFLNREGILRDLRLVLAFLWKLRVKTHTQRSGQQLVIQIVEKNRPRCFHELNHKLLAAPRRCMCVFTLFFWFSSVKDVKSNMYYTEWVWYRLRVLKNRVTGNKLQGVVKWEVSKLVTSAKYDVVFALQHKEILSGFVTQQAQQTLKIA
jgi:hypothetical protein